MSVKENIQKLAKKYKITAKITDIDKLAKSYNKLSDANVKIDTTEQLIINLRRAGHISAKESINLHTKYILDNHGL